MTISTRHKWGEPERFQFKTERQCTRCDMVKVTRHDDPQGRPWQEFWRDLDQVRSDGTPPCDARIESAGP